MNTIVKLSTSVCLSIAAFAASADSISNLDDTHSINKLPSNASTDTQFIADIGWDSDYISEGRNNLDSGGMTWGTLAVQHGNLNIFAIGGRADSQDYTEWNFGLEYSAALSETVELSVGYQRLEFYGDERSSDNELFSSLTYHFKDWLVPSLAYTYSTEAGGYFIEASVHSPWELSDSVTVAPYITQAFDFQYVTEEHNGVNHFQFGIEAEYVINHQLIISGHLSHTIAQEDIKREAREDNNTASLDQTYAGIHLTWYF